MRRPTVVTLSSILLAAGATIAPAQESPAADTAAGRRLFESVCSACHTLNPPAKLAPPMTHVVRHYRERYPERERFVERVMAFVRAPSADSSVLPAMARERFGLMPALPLPAEQLRDVAAYLWTLDAPAHGGHAAPPGPGPGQGQGQGGHQGHGRPPAP